MVTSRRPPSPPTSTFRRRFNSSSGFIYGDIHINKNDVINVSNGETDFNGQINDPTYNGTLHIASGGNLFLEDRNNGAVTYNMGIVDEGTIVNGVEVVVPAGSPEPAGYVPATGTPTASAAWVNTFKLDAGGILTIEQPALAGPAATTPATPGDLRQ